MNGEHDELEELIASLAPTPEAREALLEEHRQLEKDLLRLADPPPPPDFVSAVMAKVAAQPRRAISRAEVLSASLVVFAALGVAAWAFLSRDAGVSGVGVVFAQLVLKLRGLAVGFGSALEALWVTAALPLSVSLLVTLVGCLMALRRLVAAAPSEAKVVS